MDRNLADIEGIVWNSAGALIGVVILRAPYITPSGGCVKLAGCEKFQVTVEETQEGNILVSNSVSVADSFGDAFLGGFREKWRGSVVFYLVVVWNSLLLTLSRHVCERMLRQKEI